jgi:hypothetical protein
MLAVAVVAAHSRCALAVAAADHAGQVRTRSVADQRRVGMMAIHAARML